MRPLKSEEKKLLIICVAISLIALVATIVTPGFGIFSRVKEMKEVVTQLHEKEDQLKEAKRRQTALPQLEKAIEEAKREIAEVERRLPGDKMAPELFKELNDLAEIAKQEYKSMVNKPVEDKGTYIEIPLEITLKADYHNLGRYINMIERSKRFAKVDQLEIAYDFEDPSTQSVKLTVSTFMFVKKSAPSSSG